MSGGAVYELRVDTERRPSSLTSETVNHGGGAVTNLSPTSLALHQTTRRRVTGKCPSGLLNNEHRKSWLFSLCRRLIECQLKQISPKYTEIIDLNINKIISSTYNCFRVIYPQLIYLEINSSTAKEGSV